MVTISDKVSESLSEYLVQPGRVQCRPEDFSLETKLGENIVLQYPYMTARMQSVVGPDMTITGGRHGILTCIPRSLRDIDKQAIIDANKGARLQKGNIEYLENPECTHPDTAFSEVLRLVAKTGHSVIPVLDRFSKVKGFYIHDPDNMPFTSPNTPIREIMTPLHSEEHPNGIPYVTLDQTDRVSEILKGETRFVPLIDQNDVLHKLAFQQKFDTNYLGIAISTRGNWKNEIETWGPQVDTLMIDSSNAWFPESFTILKYAKKRFPDKPFGIGNIVGRQPFLEFAEAEADYLMCGMGVGSICETGSTRGNGRGQFTAALELAQARDQFNQQHGRHVCLAVDGAIQSKLEMCVALTCGDLIMMGNYFNRFIEAAAPKLGEDKKTYVTDENLIHYIETWGEGHPRARLVAMYGMNFRENMNKPAEGDAEQSIQRYGHASLSSATIEGKVGIVKTRGRLKPNVEEDARYLRTTMANSGATNLAEYRDVAVLERASPMTLRDMRPHDIEVIEE